MNTLSRMADGEILTLGYNPYPGEPVSAKFFSDGTQDTGYVWSYFPPAGGTATPLADGGAFYSAGGTDAQITVSGLLYRTTRGGFFDYDFQLDSSIYPNVVTRYNNGTLKTMYVGSRLLARQSDGKLLFVYLASDNLFHFVRLMADGAIDSSFHSAIFSPFDLTFGYPTVVDPFDNYQTVQPSNGAWTATPPLFDAEVMNDGKIIIVGRFNTFNDVAAHGLVRLLPNGTVDSSFPSGGGAAWVDTSETDSFYPYVEQVESTSDGKLLFVGTFEKFNDIVLPGIVLLNSDGSNVSDFSPVARRLKYRLGTAQLNKQADGSLFLAGPYARPNESEASFIHILSAGGIPVIGSPSLATALVGKSFTYQIVASGQATSYSASGLPPGFLLDSGTGIISGSGAIASIGSYNVLLTATNGEGTSTPYPLTLVVPAFLTRITSDSNHHRILDGIGVPNSSLAIHAGSDLSLDSFEQLDTVTVGADGRFEYVDTTDTSATKQFYRIAFP